MEQRCFKPVRQARLFGCLANALLGPSTIPRTLAKALIAPGPSPQEVRVLIAEDNAVNQMVTFGQLKKLGYSADVGLYWYREYGYAPEREILTGPVIIDKANVDEWITLVQGVIGLDNFQKQIPW